jgi:hypothetical protein
VFAVFVALLCESLDETDIGLELPAVVIQVAAKEASLLRGVESVIACTLAIAFCGAALSLLRAAIVVFGFAAFGGTSGFARTVLVPKRSPGIAMIFLSFRSALMSHCLKIRSSPYLCRERVGMVLVTPQLPLIGVGVLFGLGLLALLALILAAVAACFNFFFSVVLVVAPGVFLCAISLIVGGPLS